MERLVLSRAAIRRASAAAVCDFDSGGVSESGRALCKLGDSVLGSACGSARRNGRAGRGHAARPAQRCVFSGRIADDSRPIGKNAILIVEFAKDLQAQGKTAFDAALFAARLRLRPILMTSMAFTLGVLPLAVSTGPGAASRHADGVGVIGGMLSATFIAIFMIPMFYLLVMNRKSNTQTSGQGL